MKSPLWLVTGGSGFLGINLIRFLLKKGVRVRALDIAEFTYPEVNRVEFVKGDIRDRGLLNKAARDVNIVVHCAAALPLYSKEDIFSTEVEGTEGVLRAALKNKARQVIMISSTAVYGVPDHHPILETDQLVGVGPYGEAKIKAEELCLSYQQKGLGITILRPKSFVGPERLGVFALLYDWAKSGKNFPILGSGRTSYQLLDVEDLVEAIYLCTKLSKARVNEVFNIGAVRFTTIKEDFQAVLTEAGFGKRIVCLPAEPIIIGLKVLEYLGLSPLYQWIYETVGKDSYVSVDKAKKILDFKPKYSNSQALVRNYRWYLKNLDQIGGQSGISHRVPWKQGILGFAKLFF